MRWLRTGRTPKTMLSAIVCGSQAGCTWRGRCRLNLLTQPCWLCFPSTSAPSGTGRTPIAATGKKSAKWRPPASARWWPACSLSGEYSPASAASPRPARPWTSLLLDSLIAEGSGAMARILPNECIIGDSARAADAALLFLIYPLEVTDAAVTAEIIARVETELKGEVGIRRYIGDSFWCADYDSLLPENCRTINVSEDMTARDALVRPGEEAQWCLFDPLLSTIFGRRFLAGGNPIHRAQQV